ncbi:MAG: nucleotidyltransferase domain-containing protein [Nanoarchaeota archaeon]
MHKQEFEADRLHIHPYSKEDFDLARRFAQDLSVQLKGLLREVVFFGSSARGKATEIYERDIDVLVLLNDGFKSMSNETITAYRIITEKAAAQVSGRLHINTLKVSAFWEYALNGDPVAVNMIRDGIPLLNAGFIEPFKSLLNQGSIKPSKGNVMVYMIRAPQTLMASRWHVLQAMIDLYWASLDAAHAALIRYGYAPESPKETIRMLDSKFVKAKLLDRSHLATITELYDISEGIIDRSIKDVKGAKYSSFERRASSFVAEMKRLISQSAG